MFRPHFILQENKSFNCDLPDLPIVGTCDDKEHLIAVPKSGFVKII